MSWVDRTSDEYWVAARGAAWNAGGWWDVPGTDTVELQDKGNWAEGFRPTLIRMTFSGGAVNQFRGEDASPNTIWYNGSYTSGTSVAISWSTNDLFALLWYALKDPPAQITKIEFFDPVITTTTTTMPPCGIDEPQSDDFNNSSLEPFWTWQDVSAVGSYVEENTYLKITAGDWNKDDDPIPPAPTWVYQDCTCAFDINTKVLWPESPLANYQEFGITVSNYYPGATSYYHASVEFYYIAKPGEYRVRASIISQVGTSSPSVTWTGTPGDPIYLRLTRDPSGLIKFYWRLEGSPTWSEISVFDPPYINGWSQVGLNAQYASSFGAAQYDIRFDYFLSELPSTTTTTTSITTTTTSTLPEQFYAQFDFFEEWTEASTTTTTTVTWPPGVCPEPERYDPRWTENYFHVDWPQEFVFQSNHNTKLDHCGTFKPHGFLGYYPGDFSVDMRFELSRPMRNDGVDRDYIGLAVNIENLRTVTIVLTSDTQQKARRLDSDGCVFSESFGTVYKPTEVWLRVSRTDSDFNTYFSYDRIKWYEITVASPQTYSGLVTVHFGAYHRTGGQKFEARYQFWTLWPDGPSWLKSGAYLPHLIESDDFNDNILDDRWFKRHGTYFRPTSYWAEGCIWEDDQVLKVQTSPEEFYGPYNEFNGTWAWQDVKGFFNLTVKINVIPGLIVDGSEMGIIARELPTEGEPTCRVIYTKQGGNFYFKRVDVQGSGSSSETVVAAGSLSTFWLGLRWYKDGFTASYSLNGINWNPIAAPTSPITPTNWLQVGCAAKGWTEVGPTTTTITVTTTTLSTTIPPTPTTTSTTTTTGTTTSTSIMTTTSTVWYESFNGSDGDPPNPAYWVEHDSGGVMSIQSNKLNFDSSSIFAEHSWVEGTFLISGDIDITLEYDWDTFMPAVSGDSFAARLLLYKVPAEPTTPRVVIGVYWGAGDPSPVFRAHSWPDGNIDSIQVAPSSGKFRITRVGAVWKAYYEIGSGWEWDGNPAGLTFLETYINVSRVEIEFLQGNAGIINSNVNNLILYQGAIL